MTRLKPRQLLGLEECFSVADETLYARDKNKDFALQMKPLTLQGDKPLRGLSLAELPKINIFNSGRGVVGFFFFLHSTLLIWK